MELRKGTSETSGQVRKSLWGIHCTILRGIVDSRMASAVAMAAVAAGMVKAEVMLAVMLTVAMMAVGAMAVELVLH